MNVKNYLKKDYTSLCDVCRRNQGYNPKNDDLWICKYGCHELGDINVKCKYFKRTPKYYTYKAEYKNRESVLGNKYHYKITYKQGRFIKIDLLRL